MSQTFRAVNLFPSTHRRSFVGPYEQTVKTVDAYRLPCDATMLGCESIEAELLQRISDGVWLWSEVISAFATLAPKGGSFDRTPCNLAFRLLPASWTLSVVGVL